MPLFTNTARRSNTPSLADGAAALTSRLGAGITAVVRGGSSRKTSRGEVVSRQPLSGTSSLLCNCHPAFHDLGVHAP